MNRNVPDNQIMSDNALFPWKKKLQCSSQRVIGPYPEPVESTRHSYTIFSRKCVIPVVCVKVG